MGKVRKFDTVEELLEISTKDIMEECTEFLLSYYPGTAEDEPQVYVLDDDFVYAIGSSPITIVAHVDTVRDRYEKNKVAPTLSAMKPMLLVHDRNVLRNANGVLGADDRAGVFGCLELVRRCAKYKLPLPSVILTNGEENGGIGVGSFVSSKVFEKFDKGLTRLFVEMDRCNATEWVTYGSSLPAQVVSYVESFGFHQGHGSYSDICDLQEEYLIPAVNLSIGYYQQHSESERLHLDEMHMTIHRVYEMIKDPIDKLYSVEPYTPSYYGGHGSWNRWDDWQDWSGSKSKDKGDTTKGNEKSGKGKERKEHTSFPHNKPGDTDIDIVLDFVTNGGFCKSCGFMWNDCECGDVLESLTTCLSDVEVQFLLDNYLSENDPTHIFLTAHLEAAGKKDKSVTEEDLKDPFYVGNEGATLLLEGPVQQGETENN